MLEFRRLIAQTARPYRGWDEKRQAVLLHDRGLDRVPKGGLQALPDQVPQGILAPEALSEQPPLILGKDVTFDRFHLIKIEKAFKKYTTFTG